MKRFLLGLTVLVSCGLICWGCSDDDTDNGGNAPDKTAEFITFGFYAADNPGLTTDYVGAINDNMILRLPEGTDKTALVARFTVPEGFVVMVGSAEQVSGVTANDFTYPVDYVVRDEEAGIAARYAVNVGKILEKVWTNVASFNDGDFANVDFAMCLSPKDNLPNFIVSRKNADDIAAGVVGKYNGTSIATGSEMTYDSDGTLFKGTYLDIAADGDGNVYALYYNSNKLASGSYDRKYYLKRGSGSVWTAVGAPFGIQSASANSIDIDPVTKKIVVGFQANAASGAISKRNLDVCYYDGTSWSSENTIPDIAGKNVYLPKTAVAGGALYMGALVQNVPGSLAVYKFDNGNWTTIINALPAGVSQTNFVAFGMALASDGTAYVCAGGDEDTPGTWYLTVYKCAPGETAWTRVGAALRENGTAGIGTSTKFSLAVCNNLPVVLYKNRATDKPEVVMLDPDTKQWEDPIVLGDAAINTATPCLEFDANGVGYAAFIEGTGINTLQLYKFDTEPDDLPEEEE